jgi:hypothetical protein
VDEATKLGFTFAKDFHALLITLSTGILTLTVTFLKDLAKGVPGGWKVSLGVGWVLLVASIVLGILSLMVLTGTLVPAEPRAEPIAISETLRQLGGAQVLTFLSGLAAVVIYGAASLAYHGQE